jgi:hypothetical protein
MTNRIPSKQYLYNLLNPYYNRFMKSDIFQNYKFTQYRQGLYLARIMSIECNFPAKFQIKVLVNHLVL